VPRLLPEIAGRTRGAVHRVIDGTLVFADLSGFTALSERLAALGGKAGAEEMTAVLNEVFGELLDIAAQQGGEMLKYGGDAVLLLFRGDRHAAHAVVAARRMQQGLTRVGNIATDLGRVRLRMSVGVHSGAIDFYVVGPHRELVVAGPVPTVTAAMESAADAGEILLSQATASLLPPSCAGDAKADGVLLARVPRGVAELDVVERPPADLSKYIPKALRATLAAGPVQPEHRPATIGFCFVGFDEPFELAALDETLTLIEAILATYDVTFLATDLAGGGVKVIAAAGLPVAQPDAEERMLRAARDICDANLALPVRFGIQRGHVFAGTVGPSYRMAFTVIGDVVNTAARLVARAERGEVITLAPVLERCGSEFAVEELAPFVAKGKAEPLMPLRVGAVVGRRRSADEVLPLVGRESQVAQIDTALDALRRGEGDVLDIVGDAGMGKSRLVDELVAHAEDLRMVRVEAHELDSARPYGVAEALLRQLVGVDSVAKLRRRVRERAPELVEWMPLFGVAMGFDIKPTKTTERLAPQAVPAKIREVASALVAASVDRPTVVVVEDLHWADAPSARFLQALAAARASMPLLIAATRRPVEGTITPSGTTVEVTDLGDAAAGAMLDRLVDKPLLPDQRRALIARAGGNPMFLRELAVSIAAGMEGELPDRVESLIEARIDRLDAADRAVLRAASVVGDEFTNEEVVAAVGEPVTPLVWDRLAGFITADTRLRFRHALMRDSAYAGLPFRTRRQLHQRVGTFLEAGPDAEDNVERLAVHFAAAADDVRTWRYGAAAGDRARARYAYAEAASFFTTAMTAKTDVDAAERFRVLDSQAYCLQTSGNVPGALDVVRRGQRTVRNDPEQRARLLLQTATIELMMGQLEHAARAARTGLRLTTTSRETSPSHVRLLTQRSRIEEARGRYDAAHRFALEAQQLAERRGDKPALAHALAARFSVETELRTLGREVIGERARQAYVALGQHRDAASVLNFIGVDYESSGMFKEAIAAYLEAELFQQSAGLQLHAAVAAYNRANVLSHQGKWAEAEPIIDRVLGVFTASGYALGRLAAMTVRGQLLSARGEHEAAAADIREAAEAFRSAGVVDEALAAEVLLAETYVIAGDTKAARKSLPRLEETKGLRCRAQCIRAHAVVRALSAGPAREVRALLDSAVTEARENELPFMRATSQVIRGRLFPDCQADAIEAQSDLDRMGVLRIPLVEVLTTA
jgi:class 3 adenylate cyclase/tetratricopeptide (TPR) repeat protein